MNSNSSTNQYARYLEQSTYSQSPKIDKEIDIDAYDKSVSAFGPKDILKLSTGITKSANDRFTIGLALMYVLAKTDKSISLNEKKDIISKAQWNDVKKYLGQPREVYEQITKLKDTVIKGQINRKLIAKAKELMDKTCFERTLSQNRELTVVADFVL